MTVTIQSAFYHHVRFLSLRAPLHQDVRTHLHNGAPLPQCARQQSAAVCPTLKRFDTKKALSDHRRYHKKKACVHCCEEYSVPNLKRHQATCPDRPIEADENDAPTTPTPAPVNMEPLTKFPTRSLVLRSAYRAPSKASAEVAFADYLEWPPTALGRPLMKNPDAHFNKFRTNPDAHFNKFRTVLGKMERHYEREFKELASIIRSPSRCKLVFEPKLLDAFTRSLSSSDSNTKLPYVRALYLYLEWMVKIRGCSHLSMALELFGTTQTNLARVKEVEVNRKGKPAHFTKLPSVPQFVAYIDKLLRPAARRALLSELATPWTKYKAYRDYMLVALLFLVPPQCSANSSSLRPASSSSSPAAASSSPPDSSS
ncbi:TPA: hypothetical protein N0F65_002801 [Lagenidium giganteum]|uniref:Uncharacterized protein n=1 Tax=Lagenidium giganteum TaxID=4803 RepID=A0AAV2ZE22_9STRA|nr:TPA: hypothetical protein N0F65_002801 [Lagenidium giganteum]